MKRTLGVLAVTACASGPVPAPAIQRVDQPLAGAWNLVPLEEPGDDGAISRR
jgi:hypothetical protein